MSEIKVLYNPEKITILDVENFLLFVFMTAISVLAGKFEIAYVFIMFYSLTRIIDYFRVLKYGFFENEESRFAYIFFFGLYLASFISIATYLIFNLLIHVWTLFFTNGIW